MTLSALRTLTWSPSASLAWPDRRPLDVLDYGLDLSAWLADTADCLLTVQAVAQPAGWLASPVPGRLVGCVVSLMLSGGLAGQSGLIDLLVTTTAGRVKNFRLACQCIDGLAIAPATATPELLTSTGARLLSSTAMPLALGAGTAPPLVALPDTPIATASGVHLLSDSTAARLAL